MDDLSPAELREVRKAIRAAYERGRAAERKEFDAFLARMRALKELNGSGDAFLKAYSDREPSREEDRRPDPHAAVAEAMLAHAEESMANGDDHLPGVESLRRLLDDPAELGRVLAEGGADDEAVGKAVWSVLKAWDESKHPRGKGGHFISRDRIEAAKSDPKLAKQLKQEVKPEDAGKLDAALEGKTDLGRTKRGEAKHQAGQRRATREEAKAKTAKFMTHFKRVGDLKAELTADDLHDLADHLGSEHVTIEDVRAMRRALAGAGAGRASFGGAKAKGDMVKALQAHARKAGLEARMREHGVGGDDAEDMRSAVGLGTGAGETPAPEPAARGAVPAGGQYGAWGRAAAGEAPAPEPEPEAEPETTAETTPGVAKEPWQMTRKEWASADGGKFAAGRRATHLTHVLAAAEAGKPIPDAVRKEYRKHLAEAEEYNAKKRAAEEAARQTELSREASSAAAIANPESVTAEQYASIPNSDAHSEWSRRAHNFGRYVSFGEFLRDRHRAAVSAALAAGKPVPPEVLADYPDLAPPPAAGAAPEATEDMLAGKAPLPDMSTLSRGAPPAPAAEPPPGEAPRRKPTATRKPAGKQPAAEPPPVPLPDIASLRPDAPAAAATPAPAKPAAGGGKKPDGGAPPRTAERAAAEIAAHAAAAPGAGGGLHDVHEVRAALPHLSDAEFRDGMRHLFESGAARGHFDESAHRVPEHARGYVPTEEDRTGAGTLAATTFSLRRKPAPPPAAGAAPEASAAGTSSVASGPDRGTDERRARVAREMDAEAAVSRAAREGAKLPPIDLADPAALGREATAAAARLHSWDFSPRDPSNFLPHKVPIADVYDALAPRLGGATLDRFKDALVRSFSSRGVQLEPIDMRTDSPDRDRRIGAGAVLGGSAHAVSVPRDYAAPPAAGATPTPAPGNSPTRVDTPTKVGDTAPTPATGTGGTVGGGKVDAKRLSPKESDELERIIAGAGSLPESVAGHPDPTSFAADLLDRIESGDADAADIRTVHEWLVRDADRYGRGPSGSRSEAARLAALVAKMGG